MLMTVWPTSIVLLKEFFQSAESRGRFQNPLIFLLALVETLITACSARD